MIQELQLRVLPQVAADSSQLKRFVSEEHGIAMGALKGIRILRRSIDARQRTIFVNLKVRLYVNEESADDAYVHTEYRDVSDKPQVIVVGAGPGGLFAALRLIELGFRPIVLERGKNVHDRKKDLANISRTQQVDEESNYCFGEGGAGAYSDGKLYTRSTKRGNIADVMRKFVEHGADPIITIDAHAHIGTDRLSGIIANIRATIIGYGGEIHFGQRVDDLVVDPATGRVKGVRCVGGDTFEGHAVLLATGHSARDIYELFCRRGWLLEAKPFAIGVRVEHPQRLIDDIQYHGPSHSPLLPPSAYSLTTQVDGHGVFSFCMCPGGIIVPAATADGEQVVNGMSNASRSSAFANSGIAVTVAPSDVPEYGVHGAMALLRFQQDVERRAAAAAGGGLKAPTQRLTDFCEGKGASRLNRTNYMGQTVGVELDGVLPDFVARCLKQGFRDFGRKMRGFYTDQASLLAVESRTSSPIRIPRGDDGQHPQLRGLYPCGEGAGYAGGIVSSALDGIRQMEQIAREVKGS